MYTHLFNFLKKEMEHRPIESMKSVATELASLLTGGSTDYSKMEGLLSMLAFKSNSKTNTLPWQVKRHPKFLTSIGIWQPIEVNKEIIYRRDPRTAAEWHYWANAHEIKPKGNKKRVLLLGESAARGFLYDPVYNIASELRGTFAMIPEARDYEVVDLARIALPMDDLFDLTKASADLQPDAVIVFAGNNWVYLAPEGIEDFAQVYDLFSRESFKGLKAFLEDRMRKKVIEYLSMLNGLFSKNNIPVIFVIPEFNLKDWRSNEVEQILPWAPGGIIKKWIDVARSCRKAFDENRIDEAGEFATEMVELDPSNPLGYEMLADHYLQKGMKEQARESLESARDTILFNRANQSMPRCVGIIRKTLLEESSSYNITPIDLPAIFRSHDPDGIPGRSFFLDNCHLSFEGIRMVARHMVKALLKVLNEKSVDVSQVKESGIKLDGMVKAIAHFRAAIYNSHHGQPKGIIAFHCREAIRNSEDIKEVMQYYVDFMTRKAPTFLCKSFSELILSGEMSQFEEGLSMAHPRNNKLMDVELVDIIMSELDASPKGKDYITDLRIREHLATSKKINLLESYYCNRLYNKFTVSPEIPYHQARSVQSRFYFVGEKDMDVSVEWVYRTPLINGTPVEGIHCFINGQPEPAGNTASSANWISRSFKINRELLKRGVNELVISWPYSTNESFKIRESPSSLSFLKELFPVLGEIHALWLHISQRDNPDFSIGIKNNC
jgi:hypothetical protein